MKTNATSRLTAILVLTVLLVSNDTQADIWTVPAREKYYSPTNKCYFDVTPPEWSTQQVENLEQELERLRLSGRTADDPPRGLLFRKNRKGRFEKVWGRDLINEVAPVDVLVPDACDYVVTLDNWYHSGYGDDIVVIYGTEGDLVKQFSLEELLGPEDIRRISYSVSSRIWLKKAYIDGRTKTLHIEFRPQNAVDTRPNLATKSDAEVKGTQLKVNLATGEILD